MKSMKLRSLRPLPLAALALAPLTTACDDHGDHGHDQTIELRFAAQVGDEAFGCDKTFMGLGTADSMATPLDFRLYLHDVRLVDSTGKQWPLDVTDDGLWQRDGLVLLDFEDKTGTCINGTTPTNRFVRGTIDPGHDEPTITGVTFKLGVPFELNHADVATAASPLNLSGLFWNWQGGYKFARLDLSVMGAMPVEGGEGGHGAGGFNIHLGSTGCDLDAGTQTVSSCAAPNRGTIALTDYDHTTDTIVIDLAEAVKGLDLSTDGGGAPGCMSGKDDPECASIFAAFGIDLTTGGPAQSQSAFRVE